MRVCYNPSKWNETLWHSSAVCFCASKLGNHFPNGWLHTLLPYWVVIGSLLSSCSSQITQFRRAALTWHYTILPTCHLEGARNQSGRLSVTRGAGPPWRLCPMYSHKSGQMSQGSESQTRCRKKNVSRVGKQLQLFPKKYWVSSNCPVELHIWLSTLQASSHSSLTVSVVRTLRSFQFPFVFSAVRRQPPKP